MNIKRNKEVFVKEHTEQIEVYKNFKEIAKAYVAAIEGYDGKVLNRRIEKFLPNCDEYHVTLGQAKYEVNYVPVLDFYCRSRKYSSNLYTDFEVKLVSNESNRFQYAETKKLFEEQLVKFDEKIADIEKAIANFDECMSEWVKMREMYENWKNKFGYIERDNNQFIIQETIR